jgi:GNAT superfamily N-acetyltransferase
MIAVRTSELEEIAPLRQQYREEMNCQIIFDSVHSRPGWTQEFALEVSGDLIGYGSMAVGGPWREKHALYEFFVQREYRMQTNIPTLLIMLHVFARNIRSESILFEDQFQTSLAPERVAFRAAEPGDVELLKGHELDDSAEWVATVDGEIAGAGGVLYHYNRPYGDIYMKVAEPFRRRGIGAYLVQELKAACRKGGAFPRPAATSATSRAAVRSKRPVLSRAGTLSPATCNNNRQLPILRSGVELHADSRWKHARSRKGDQRQAAQMNFPQTRQRRQMGQAGIGDALRFEQFNRL